MSEARSIIVVRRSAAGRILERGTGRWGPCPSLAMLARAFCPFKGLFPPASDTPRPVGAIESLPYPVGGPPPSTNSPNDPEQAGQTPGRCPFGTPLAQKNPPQPPGQKKKKPVQLVTIYHAWRPDQVEYVGWQDAEVGDVVHLKAPEIHSWTFKASKAFSAGHKRTKAKVPITSIVLTDRFNNIKNANRR